MTTAKLVGETDRPALRAEPLSPSAGQGGINPLFSRAPLGSASLNARGVYLMNMIVGTLVAFLLAGVLFSQQAEARCWWNGYNHCQYYHHWWRHHGWYYHGYWYR
jgi:hypothetical protein